jgi:hypothetical protein
VAPLGKSHGQILGKRLSDAGRRLQMRIPAGTVCYREVNGHSDSNNLPQSPGNVVVIRD